jgi:hypothetical protein
MTKSIANSPVFYTLQAFTDGVWQDVKVFETRAKAIDSIKFETLSKKTLVRVVATHDGSQGK